MKIVFISLILISTVWFQACIGAEIDSVTPRHIKLDNSITFINTIFNDRIEEGIKKANEQQGDSEDREDGEMCDEEILYKELRKAIFQSLTASWGFKGYQLDKELRILMSKQSYSLSLNDSIYRDIDFMEGFALNIKELSDVVNLNGHLVGLDKMGHFFAEGWQYFELSQESGQKLNDALEWGREQEVGKFGYATTGIFSFSDLVANFNGWQFWNRVLLKKNDPLKGFIANLFNRSYASCDVQWIDSIKNRKIIKVWEYNSQFDLSDFLDGAWDEGNNCNSYKDPVIEEKVTSRIKDINADYSCPIQPKHCVAARRKYGNYGKFLLHPSCLTAKNEGP